MRTFLVLTLLAITALSTACTTRELATGAAAGAAGYIIGKEDDED